MEKWGMFEFNTPYVGEIIEKINDVVLPNDYIEFMKRPNGGQGDIGDTWLILYRLEELQEINDDYEIEVFLPGHIIIGSNGGGELYGIDNFTDMIGDETVATDPETLVGFLTEKGHPALGLDPMM